MLATVNALEAMWSELYNTKVLQPLASRDKPQNGESTSSTTKASCTSPTPTSRDNKERISSSSSSDMILGSDEQVDGDGGSEGEEEEEGEEERLDLPTNYISPDSVYNVDWTRYLRLMQKYDYTELSPTIRLHLLAYLCNEVMDTTLFSTLITQLSQNKAQNILETTTEYTPETPYNITNTIHTRWMSLGNDRDGRQYWVFNTHDGLRLDIPNAHIDPQVISTDDTELLQWERRLFCFDSVLNTWLVYDNCTDINALLAWLTNITILESALQISLVNWMRYSNLPITERIVFSTTSSKRSKKGHDVEWDYELALRQAMRRAQNEEKGRVRKSTSTREQDESYLSYELSYGSHLSDVPLAPPRSRWDLTDHSYYWLPKHTDTVALLVDLYFPPGCEQLGAGMVQVDGRMVISGFKADEVSGHTISAEHGLRVGDIVVAVEDRLVFGSVEPVKEALQALFTRHKSRWSAPTKASTTPTSPTLGSSQVSSAKDGTSLLPVTSPVPPPLTVAERRSRGNLTKSEGTSLGDGDVLHKASTFTSGFIKAQILVLRQANPHRIYSKHYIFCF